MRTDGLSNTYLIGHPQHAWLDIVERQIQENETDCECDNADGVPQVVVCEVLRVMTMLLKRKATPHFHACKPASFYLHVFVSDRLHIIFAIIIDVLWIITRPIFEQ